MVVEQRQNNMKKGPFKMKGFTYPGSAPLKKNIATARNTKITPDAVLMEAADLMGRGIDEPTSIGGMAALGFISGFNRIKPATQSDADKDQLKKEKKEKKAERKAKRKSNKVRRQGEKAWEQDDERRKRENMNREEVIDIGEGTEINRVDGDMNVDRAVENKVKQRNKKEKKRKIRKK